MYFLRYYFFILFLLFPFFFIYEDFVAPFNKTKSLKTPKKVPKASKNAKLDANAVKFSKSALDSLASKNKEPSVMNDIDESANDNYDDDTETETDANIDTANLLKTLANQHKSLTSEQINADGGLDPKALVPGPPRDLVAQKINPQLVQLSWMEPIKNPDEVTSYSIFYKMSTSER